MKSLEASYDEIIDKFHKGYSRDNLIDYVAQKESTKKKEAAEKVDAALYEDAMSNKKPL